MSIKYLTKTSIQAALKHAAQRSERDYLIIYLLANTGIRVSELLALTPNDILDEQQQLIIRGKGDKIRNIDIPTEVYLALVLYVASKEIKNREKIIPLTRQRIQQLTQSIAGVHPHVFRHSYAIHLLRKTKNIRYVQVQLGHSTIQTTQIYLRYMEFDEEKSQLNGLYSEG